MTGSRSLGAELKAQRDAQRMTQAGLVAAVKEGHPEVSISVSTVSGIETGKQRPSPELARALDDVLDCWPNITLSLVETKIPYARDIFARPSREAPPKQSREFSRIKLLLANGRLNEARDAATSFSQRSSDPWEVVELQLLLADAEWAAGASKEATNRYHIAINAAHLGRSADLVVAAMERLCVRLSGRERYADAAEVLREWIAHYPKSTGLWRRLGHVHWYAGNFLEAYAALTTALSLGHARIAILHARGQVLPEWDHYADAVEELSQVLDTDLTETAEAYARSSLAFALGMLDDPRASIEFAASENLRTNNGWVHYFKGKWYDKNGRSEDALSAFRRALECASPPLNKHKRESTLLRVSQLAPREGSG